MLEYGGSDDGDYWPIDGGGGWRRGVQHRFLGLEVVLLGDYRIRRVDQMLVKLTSTQHHMI